LYQTEILNPFSIEEILYDIQCNYELKTCDSVLGHFVDPWAYLTEEEDSMTTGLELREEIMEETKLRARADEPLVCLDRLQTFRFDVLAE